VGSQLSTARDGTAIFQTPPASAFVVNGAAQARDSALASASAETRWMNGFSIAATFEGEFSETVTTARDHPRTAIGRAVAGATIEGPLVEALDPTGFVAGQTGLARQPPPKRCENAARHFNRSSRRRRVFNPDDLRWINPQPDRLIHFQCNGGR